jgi:hypothetical protein
MVFRGNSRLIIINLQSRINFTIKIIKFQMIIINNKQIFKD